MSQKIGFGALVEVALAHRAENPELPGYWVHLLHERMVVIYGTPEQVKELTKGLHEAAYATYRSSLDRARASGDAPVAYVPIHPRNGPLWSDTFAAGDCDPSERRSGSYERMPLYAAPVGPPADARDAERINALESKGLGVDYFNGRWRIFRAKDCDGSAEVADGQTLRDAIDAIDLAMSATGGGK